MATTLTRLEVEEMFDEALDEGELIRIGNLTYLPSQVLKNTDPIAYNEGVWDFADWLASENEYEIEL